MNNLEKYKRLYKLFQAFGWNEYNSYYGDGTTARHSLDLPFWEANDGKWMKSNGEYYGRHYDEGTPSEISEDDVQNHLINDMIQTIIDEAKREMKDAKEMEEFESMSKIVFSSESPSFLKQQIIRFLSGEFKND